MDGLELFEKIKELIESSGWAEQNCGEVYLLSSVGTNFYKDREILHLSIEVGADQESLEILKEI
jgi:hypothetical protein